MTKRSIRVVLILAALLLAGGVVLWRWKQSADRVSAALTGLWQKQDDHEQRERAIGDVAKLGAEAYPQMGRVFKDKESAFERKYRALHGKLPRAIKPYLPTLPYKAEIRRALMTSTFDLGPSASRAMVGVVGYGLDDSARYENSMLLRSLYWSIPASPKAVLVLSNYLARPKPGKMLFGMTDAREVWPQVGHLAPLLTEWLKFGDSAAEAAEALGLMGTNAHFAIPMLIDLAEDGVVGNPTNATLHLHYSPDLVANKPERNRMAAIEALGNLGVPDAPVLKLLREGWTDDSSRIREVTAYAAGTLGSKSLPLLEHFVANIDRGNSRVLQHQLDTFGRIGSEAGAAVPVLLELSFSWQFPALSFGMKVPQAAPMGYRHTLLWSNESQPGMMAAAFALARIDPNVAQKRLEAIAAALRGLTPLNAVVQLRPFREGLVRFAEPGLTVTQGMPIERILLAHHILLLDPSHEEARKYLERQMVEADFAFRAIAASWYYRATGETNRTLPVLAESLTHVTNQQNQIPLTILREFGVDGKSLATKIRPLLNHEDGIIRSLAGKALRAIAPEEMPPIREDDKW